jgi:hypothetical protein
MNFFSIYLILPAALGPAVYSNSNRNEYQKQRNSIPGNKEGEPVGRANNLVTICEPIVYTTWDTLHLTIL